MAISKISTKGMSGDTLDAGDIAPNAIGASELADNAVDTAAIAATSITEAKLNADVTDGSAIQTSVKPHIIPDTLYPAWSGLIHNHTGYTFTDSSASAHAITSSGDIHHTGSISKIGNTSISFNKLGGTDDVLQIPDHADFDFAGGDFTIEFWFNTHGGARQFLFGFESDFHLSLDYNNASATALDRINLWASSNGTGWDISHADGSGNGYGTVTVSPNTWYHVAIVRNGTSWKTYINGQQNTSITSSSALTAYNSEDIRFGRHGSNDSMPFKGYMDDIRITKGLAVYTGNFTAPTSALTTTWSAGTNIAANSTASNVKLLIHSDATGAHSGAYGTAQADSKKYYYTDIKGSKPIKDPRIGSHFGSQRHKFKSLQLLEQETATHGANVYSVDGREWVRCIGDYVVHYNTNGTGLLYSGATSTPSIEITGYFSSLNLLGITVSVNSGCVLTIDGVAGSEINPLLASTASPLGGRNVDRASVVNIVTGQTLGIHTVKITDHANADENYHFGIELIAQDTSNRNNIQIPSQNVVSYGKKFTVSGTPHYDPFNGFTNSTSLHSAYVDTATSLGLSSAPGSSASWAISGSNNIRPYNGGRVVKWVDSAGVIKTSVNMMPPNAQNIGTTASAEITTPSATNTAYLPAMSDDAIDHSLAEVAKTFHWREFGNGSANAGTHATTPVAPYADASMLNTSDDIAYVMDDGLTSLSGDDMENHATYGFIRDNVNDGFYLTFIGTGLTTETYLGQKTWGQNLPYGTHIFSMFADGSDQSQGIAKIDGVTIKSDFSGTSGYQIYNWMLNGSITFHQPKMPPIPEDAVVIADYMLMADFVAAGATAAVETLSKGTRRSQCSRDWFYKNSNSFTLTIGVDAPFLARGGLSGYGLGNGTIGLDTSLPYFGTHAVFENYPHSNRMNNAVLAGSTQSLETNNHIHISESTMGMQDATIVGSQNGEYIGINAIDVHSPIHTSSHYQTFETPFLKELVGGDRNMEQTNLVVTSDGKTWDEVTRDVSYIGNACVSVNTDTETNNGPTIIVYFDEIRGSRAGNRGYYYTKDFTMAYDRLICLKDGSYNVSAICYNTQATHTYIYLNGNNLMSSYNGGNDPSNNALSFDLYIQRGDWVQLRGGYGTDGLTYNSFSIKRI